MSVRTLCFAAALLIGPSIAYAAKPSPAKPVAKSAPAVDTTEADDDEDDSSTTASVSASSVAPTRKAAVGPKATVSDDDSSDADEDDGDDQPFENVLQPDSQIRHWSIGLNSSKAWVSKDTSDLTISAVLSRSFIYKQLTFVPRIGYSRQSFQPEAAAIQDFVFGAQATWEASDDHAISVDGAWNSETGPDSWQSAAEWSYDHEVSDWFDFQSSMWGGWSDPNRGSCGASLGGDLIASVFDLSASASYTRRYQSYVNVVGNEKTAYINAWGWSTGLLATLGKWTTGPSWSGEYWKANVSGAEKTISVTGAKGKQRNVTVAKISASGVVISQSLSWTTQWKPFPGIRVDFDLVKSFGESSMSTKSTQTAGVVATALRKKAQTTNGQDPNFPGNTVGGSLGFRFDW